MEPRLMSRWPRTSAVAAAPRDARVIWNLANCCTTV